MSEQSTATMHINGLTEPDSEDSKITSTEATPMSEGSDKQEPEDDDEDDDDDESNEQDADQQSSPAKQQKKPDNNESSGTEKGTDDADTSTDSKFFQFILLIDHFYL